ncbi:MAG: YjbQ family protein [Candidatus Omnitrophica bacterium]|nr:YjbQ family protein [Candidatus Omnitrophota bacterium]
MKKLHISSHKRNEAIDITPMVREYLGEIKAVCGIITVHSPHTTAGVTINENADPDVKFDMLFHLSQLIPPAETFKHVEGNSDAHIKATIIGCSQNVIVEEGQLQMGTWQGVYFMEFDGPREREVWLKFIPAKD